MGDTPPVLLQEGWVEGCLHSGGQLWQQTDRDLNTPSAQKSIGAAEQGAHGARLTPAFLSLLRDAGDSYQSDTACRYLVWGAEYRESQGYPLAEPIQA